MLTAERIQALVSRLDGLRFELQIEEENVRITKSFKSAYTSKQQLQFKSRLEKAEKERDEVAKNILKQIKKLTEELLNEN